MLYNNRAFIVSLLKVLPFTVVSLGIVPTDFVLARMHSFDDALIRMGGILVV